MTIYPEQVVRADGTLKEEVVDNGDGTGVRRTYDTDGTTVLSTENLPDVGPPVIVNEETRLADLEAFIEALAGN